MNTTYNNSAPEIIDLQKVCLACNRVVRGRTDKKYCDDFCRNNYNNRLNADSNNMVRNVNHALGKNRRILENFRPEKGRPVKVSFSELLHKGFQFKYYTHQVLNRKGKICFFCYDYGYINTGNNFYLILKGKQE